MPQRVIDGVAEFRGLVGQAVEEIPGGLQVAWTVTVECEGQPRPVMVAESLRRLYSDAEGSS
jgi:hypothetical protein